MAVGKESCCGTCVSLYSMLLEVWSLIKNHRLMFKKIWHSLKTEKYKFVCRMLLEVIIMSGINN